MSQNQLVSVDFHGQTLIAIEIEGTPYVAMRPIAENIGLAWHGQFERIKRNPVMNKGIRVIRTPSTGGGQETTCLPLTMLNGWLLGVDVNRVREEIRPKLIRYQEECFDVLYRHFMPQQAPTQRPYNPAIDYTRISPAQAQDIKELVHMVVDSGVQTFGETWNRLHNKFRVNSYLELPATKYDEVCAYLRGKLPPAPAPGPAPKPAPKPPYQRTTLVNYDVKYKLVELQGDDGKKGFAFASNLLEEILFGLSYNGCAAHVKLTVERAREMGNALLEVAAAQALIEQRMA